MKSSDDRPKRRQSKPKLKNTTQNRLTEDGPDGMEGKKTNPFLRFLNYLWGPIRG